MDAGLISDHDYAEWAMNWAQFPENQSLNYDQDVYAKIKDDPYKWLCSLPMYEYAYTIVALSAMKYGGELTPWIDDVYKTRMNPILKQYYDKLVDYRIKRAIHLRRYASMQNLITDTSIQSLYQGIRVYALKTRKALRGVVQDYIEQLNGTRSGPRAVEDTLQECYGSC